ncbi:conserved hypothetical protein [Ricinus communis]|uniref:Uncharacterized protein n=1 Tax=Ricinus communis TaxID=3988 RepID=B9SV89_RICCO|nr:conserved hypothetical protein [Ricinus communis]
MSGVIGGTGEMTECRALALFLYIANYALRKWKKERKKKEKKDFLMAPSSSVNGAC